MAKYTVELGDVVKSGLKIFNFDYTFYDETKKPDFEQKFINHFYFREIGQETVGRFQHYLKCKCDERLPYYNEVLKLAQLQFDILNPYSITETYEKTDTKNTSSNATVIGNKTNTLDSITDHTEDMSFTKDESINEIGSINADNTVDIDGKKIGSDTPNGLLAMEDIKNNVYASKADIEDSTTKTTDIQNTTADKTGNSTETTDRTTKDTIDATSHDTSTDTTNASGVENGTEEYTLHRIGHIGVQTKSELLEKQIEVLKQIQTVYLQFFDECEELFMQIY